MFFWNSLAFTMIQWMLAIWLLVPLPFLNPTWTSGSSWFMYCWSLKDVSIYFDIIQTTCTTYFNPNDLGGIWYGCPYSKIIEYLFINGGGCCSVAKSCLILCDPHGLQHTRPPCPSPSQITSIIINMEKQASKGPQIHTYLLEIWDKY